MATTWIIAADASRARILQVIDREKHLAARSSAPPEFLGQLRKELGKEVGRLVDHELPKDLSWLNARDLEQKLFRSHS